MGDEDFGPYEEEELIYVDGFFHVSRDEYGEFCDQMCHEYQWYEPPMARSNSDLERKVKVSENMSH